MRFDTHVDGFDEICIDNVDYLILSDKREKLLSFLYKGNDKYVWKLDYLNLAVHGFWVEYKQIYGLLQISFKEYEKLNRGDFRNKEGELKKFKEYLKTFYIIHLTDPCRGKAH